ncbi:MAG: hypothetical protein ACPGPE_03990 [Planctomycetota bacterium]
MRGDTSRFRKFIGPGAIALGSCLTSACGSLGAEGDALQSVQLADRIQRVNLEADRSDETVQAMLTRLQPLLTSRSEGAAAAHEQLDAATRACQRQAHQLEKQLPGLGEEGAAFFLRRRAALHDIEDPLLRAAAAARIEVDLGRFLEYQASTMAALDAYEELNVELHAILKAFAEQKEPSDLTEQALDLRNQACSVRMILEDCKRAATELEVR